MGCFAHSGGLVCQLGVGHRPGARVLEPLVPLGFSPPGLPALVLFVAAYFLLALQPEILSTHFREQRALGISVAGNASLCISGWDVSQVLSVLK